MNTFKDIIKKLLVVLAVKVLKKHKPYIIAIIGSVGKTTARNAIYAVLSKKNSVRKSEQSLTTDLGVPLTLLGCRYSIHTFFGVVKNIYNALYQTFWSQEYPEYVILEIDGHTKGEVKRLVDWLPVDLLVVTAIGEIPAHVEHFDTPGALRAEYELILGALKGTSKVVAYADDEYSNTIGVSSNRPVIFYGSSKEADISAKAYEILYEGNVPTGISFTLLRPSSNERIVIKETLGIHAVNGVLCAMAVLQALGEHPFSMNPSFEKMPLSPGRMRIMRGIKGSVILDDSYNSSPIAVEELISVIKKVSAEKKMQRNILVLGDMLELGRFSSEVHKEIGREIGRELGSEIILICVGVRSRFVKMGAIETGMKEKVIFQFDMPEKAGQYIQGILKTGDLVAVKGSQNMRMERCVEEIMLEPEKKEKLLVRQSEEWLGR